MIVSFDPYQRMVKPKKILIYIFIFRVEISYTLFYSIPPLAIMASCTVSGVHSRIAAQAATFVASIAKVSDKIAPSVQIHLLLLLLFLPLLMQLLIDYT